MTFNRKTLLVLHISGLPWGSAAGIARFHTRSKERGGRGWSQIGYHDVIHNGYLRNTSNYQLEEDGRLVRTIPEGRRGIHAWGVNRAGDAHAVCLIGSLDEEDRAQVTAAQLWQTTERLADLITRHSLPGVENIWGHSELADHPELGEEVRRRASLKVCPGLDMDEVRDRVSGHLGRILYW